MFWFRGISDIKVINKLIAEINADSDRATAIVGGAMTEAALEGALLAHLHRNKKITDKIFDPTAALGVFASKIDLGFLVGLYGEAAHSELHTIRRIRNKFAHSLAISSFADDSIKDSAMNLMLCERYTISPADAATAKPPDKDKTPAEWDWWFTVPNRSNALLDPRQRFIVTIQVMHYGLSIPLEVAMPAPNF